jgi:hypothetical protein
MKTIIALCGKKRSGKDTVAHFLSTQYGYQHLKLAQPLKDAMHVLFGFTTEQMETDVKDTVDLRWGITPRRAMQYFGTEVMQYHLQEVIPSIERNFFVHRLMHQIHQCENEKDSSSPSFVISDMRFMHEFNALLQFSKERGYHFKVLEIVRGNHIQGPNSQENTHSSEVEYKMIPKDHIIFNDEGIPQLYKKMTAILGNTMEKEKENDRREH